MDVGADVNVDLNVGGEAFPLMGNTCRLLRSPRLPQESANSRDRGLSRVGVHSYQNRSSKKPLRC